MSTLEIVSQILFPKWFRWILQHSFDYTDYNWMSLVRENILLYGCIFSRSMQSWSLQSYIIMQVYCFRLMAFTDNEFTSEMLNFSFSFIPKWHFQVQFLSIIHFKRRQSINSEFHRKSSNSSLILQKREQPNQKAKEWFINEHWARVVVVKQSFGIRFKTSI